MTSSRCGHKLERLELVLCSGQHVLMPGFDRQELAEAKAQINHEYSLCPGLRSSALRAAKTPSAPLPPRPCSSGIGLSLPEHLPFSKRALP